MSRVDTSVPVTLAVLRPGDHVVSGTGQVFRVKAVNIHRKQVTVVAVTELRGAGSARAQKVGEERTLANGHQWCMRMSWYDATKEN